MKITAGRPKITKTSTTMGDDSPILGPESPPPPQVTAPAAGPESKTVIHTPSDLLIHSLPPYGGGVARESPPATPAIRGAR